VVNNMVQDLVMLRRRDMARMIEAFSTSEVQCLRFREVNFGFFFRSGVHKSDLQVYFSCSDTSG
jgi:hypothetical protein